MSDKIWNVYTIIERPGYDKSFWVRVGRGFVNRDGSYNLALDALPTNGKLHLRLEAPRERPAAITEPVEEQVAL